MACFNPFVHVRALFVLLTDKLSCHFPDLGWTVTDLIRKKGSNAAKVLTDKADELEKALKDTTENFSVEMMED